MNTEAANDMMFSTKEVEVLLRSIEYDPIDSQDIAAGPTSAKGYAYFRTFLEQYYTTSTPGLGGADATITVNPDKDRILAALPKLRDWTIQAGASPLNATDTQNRNAFMFGSAGEDNLTGGTGSDLLVGNAANDSTWMIVA